MGSIPDPGKSHMLWATKHLEPVFPNKRSLCLLQVEKACVQRQRVSIAKNELFLKIKLDISPPLLKLSNGPDNGNKIQHLTTAESPACSALIFSPTSFPL